MTTKYGDPQTNQQVVDRSKMVLEYIKTNIDIENYEIMAILSYTIGLHLRLESVNRDLIDTAFEEVKHLALIAFDDETP